MAELNGMRAVMWRLWPTDAGIEWYDSAMFFLEFCTEAGLQEEQWRPLVCARFSDVLNNDVMASGACPPSP